jgi:hypothetical protein
MESYLGILWINPATATTHQKLMGNVPTHAGRCVYYTKRLAEYAMSPTLDKHNKN